MCGEKNKISDVELYKLFLEGDNQAFNFLIIRHRKNLTDFLMTYLRNIESAEDIAQDSFMYMIVNKTEYDFKYSFKTYLYTIAKSRALNYLKKSKKTIFVEDVINNTYVNFDENVESNFIEKENYENLKKVIKKLKKEYQIVIYLYYFQGFKYAEISKILNQSMSKTKMAIHRAKKLLKKYLKEDNNYDK